MPLSQAQTKVRKISGVIVDDPELLRTALLDGIGRAKGYGFGLLTLVPLADDYRTGNSAL